MKRIVELSLVVIVLAILLTVLISPLFNFFPVASAEDLVKKATSNLAPFDYFYLSKESINENWSYKIDSFEHGNINIYYDSSYDSSSWDKINIPFLFKATKSNCSMWVRTFFKIPEAMKEENLRLIFPGVWCVAKAWLNGIYLGEHYGYFSPFFFDIDDAVNREGVNTLTLYIESPVQDSYTSRIYPVGPYSFSEVFPNLKYALIGVWRDVVLVGTYGTVVNLVLVDVKQYSNPASLSLKILTQNKERADENVMLVIRVRKPGFVNTTIVEQSFNVKLYAKEIRWNNFEISLPNPEFWSPWDSGVPNVYFLNISLYRNDDYCGSVETIFGIRSLEGDLSPTSSYIKINGINSFLRGGAYFTKYCSLTSLYQEIDETLDLFRNTNINSVRTFAHVAPKEFYELASMKGFIVQTDFPLIGSYPSLDYSQSYSEIVEIQLIELLFLTYNYPSVVIICPHTLPSWVNEESPYYSLRVNYYLDFELENLVKTVRENIILIPYSGYYDEYIDYGWGTGSWIDYTRYEGAFPNIIVPTGIPSLNSHFWNSIPTSSYGQTLQSLIERGLDLQLVKKYWLDPSLNLSTLVKLSQDYQALVVRRAIDRMRILKNNISVGVSLLPLSDYLPSVSGSIIDYFGFKKQVYYDVKNAFNPVHTIILVDGDYENNLTSMYFISGSTTRISLWVTNDAFQNQFSAILNWRLIDITSDELLFNEEIEFNLPASFSGAMLVKRHVFEAPQYIDAEHVLEVFTELSLKNGTKVDVNSQQFTVKPSSLLRVKLDPEPSQPQLFLILMSEGYRTIKILNEAVIAVPSNTDIAIIGPSLNRMDVYVPEIVSLGRLPPGEVKDVRIRLYPGAVVKVLATVPSLTDSTVPSQETYVNLIGETNNNLLLDYTLQRSFILNLLNITGNIIIIPAEKDVKITVSISSGIEKLTVSIGNETQPINLRRNVEVYLDQPALAKVKSNQLTVDTVFAAAEKLVNETRRLGFYTGLELHRLSQVKELYRLVLNTSDPVKILSYQKEAITASEAIVENIQSMLKEARTNQILVFVIVILLALAISSIFIEKKEQFAMFTIISFIVFMTIAYQAFPGFSVITTQDLLMGGYLVFIIFGVAFIAPYFIGEVKSEKGVSLIPAIIIAISYSVRNLKKKKLRTLLTLISITTMALALATLTSTRLNITTNSLSVAKTWPADTPPYVIVTRSQGYLGFEDLGFIGAQREVLKTGYRMVTPVAYSALGFIDKVPIYGVLGIFGESPSFNQLKGVSYPEDAIEKMFNDGYSVLISNHLAKSVDIDLGMVIIFRGVKLKVVGIFNGSAISNIKEPDGSDFLPLYVPPAAGAGAQTIPGDYLLITNAYTAQKLGCSISAIYCITSNNTQAKEVSERLVNLGNYFAITMLSSEGIRYYFRGFSIEVFGTAASIPIMITVLSIAIVFYRAIYERKNEIFILSSIGLNPTHISSLFLTEFAILGFIGGGIGYVLSMLMFKTFDVSNIIVPINVKSSNYDMLYVMLLAVTVAVLSSVIPALRASKIATHSLLRRWKIEERAVKGDTWTVQIPLRIPTERVEIFVDYLYERLPQSGTLMEILISDVKHEERVDEFGNVVHQISFNYGRSGNRPFNAYTAIEIKRDGENYMTYVNTKPKSVYARMHETNVREVVDHVRRLVLEWSVAKFNIALVIGSSVEQALAVVKNYHPRLLVVYSRRDITSELRELRRRLRSEGMWPPTIEIRNVEVKDIHSIIEKLSEELASLDAVFLDSDDGLLSAALAMVAMRLNKNIAIITTEGKVHEIPARNFIEYST